MKKTVLLLISLICISLLYSCTKPAPEKLTPSNEISNTIEEDAIPEPDDSAPALQETDKAPMPFDVVPESLVFTTDGSGKYYEPVLGEWEAFLADVFKHYDSGEVDPGSENIKYYGEGNDGGGYCFIVTTRSDKSGILSYNIDTAIISGEPNSGGDQVSGQDMVRWMYENYAE